MNWYSILAGIVGLGLLMIVHEGGHLVVARAFGMRVTRFSIGFGPTLWRHQPKGSDTIYQIGLIPFLAYVQIAGMNPFEEVDPEDKGSYANASLVGRISAIFAGPLANYLFASVFFFIAFMIGGKAVYTTSVEKLAPDGPAAAVLQVGDEILKIDGVQMKSWEHLQSTIVKSPGKSLDLEVRRKNQRINLSLTPKPNARGEGKIGIYPGMALRSMGVQEAAIDSVVYPAQMVKLLVLSLGQLVSDLVAGRGKPDLSGPVGIMGEFSRAADEGLPHFLRLLGMLSAYIGGFNLIPFPALDGGRLMFLGYEAVTRRRPEPKLEAQVHLVGLLLLLALILVVTVGDVRALLGPTKE